MRDDAEEDADQGCEQGRRRGAEGVVGVPVGVLLELRHRFHSSGVLLPQPRCGRGDDFGPAGEIEAQLRADLLAQVEEISTFWTNKMRSASPQFKDADYRFTLTAGPSFKKCVFEGDELGPEEDILDKGGDGVCIWFEFEVEVTQVSRSQKKITPTCACVVM